MSEIEIAEGKTLKLNKVLYKQIDGTTNESLEKTMKMFDSYMKSHSLEPYGPSIIRARSTISGGQIISSSDMMVQLREIPAKVLNPYGFEESIRIENCLMARYRGPMSALQVAYSKLQVYSFEHDIKLSGTVYTIFVEQSPNGDVMADIFTEVIS